ncbi:LysE family transporter [Acinetobacter baumannii]|jgi:homoserine/homoserine lactone efflux protein|uniref:Homoserine/homoserine lactone efflux protein n=8 Tax=Acinetobacter calcoaceticus/baumannii complex TaxID=909768 RepID=A0A0D5YN88_ACIBA|nr:MULTISPECIES: LysE family transporter [Acinetobacter]EMT94150.1 homoserine/homoserine lactone efflux protein [Acinetobacter baumannii ABNIH6]EMU00356.1 homoserine/homoserine lactone efflux protein [Acinetobacter baumannii ABNIH10]EXG32393.1 lysE type translocator family protein [Acinetobacter baumannii 121738]EYD48763.1 lysE type translocator family protein [Acinetobacter baumannii 25493_4]EYS10795.1 lysE type translocator family protein [Acinetobacter baumannii 25569_7]PXA52942.1 threonin
MSLQVWFAYMLACWVISISPGAGAIASMSSGLNYGFRHGYWNAIGLQIALLIQIMIVAAGVGVLFATTPLAFQAVKWFGVAYLLYLAYLQWTAPVKDIEIQHEKKDKSVSALLFNGFVVNISNPKAIVFLLAVLPQFLDLSKPQWIQYLIMAATMVTIDLIVMAGYTGLASKVLRLLRSPKQQKYLNRGFAVMFSCAALLLSTVHQAA